MEEKLSKLQPSERIKALSEAAGTLSFDGKVPLSRYVRSSKEILRMARSYEMESSLDYAYIYYLRFLTLYLDKLPSHPDYKTLPAAERKELKSQCGTVFESTERIKQQLNLKYEREYEREYEAFLRHREKSLTEELSRAREHMEQDRVAREKQLALVQSKLSERRDLWREYQHSASEHHQDADRQLENSISDNDPSPMIQASAAAANAPNVPDRSTKPAGLTITAREFLMEGTLRCVELPSDLVVRFLAVASQNTAANVETCGILSGKLSQNSFRVTHILVPSQTGTSDSCTTHSEEDVFATQDKLDLLTLGWIHTHPSQSAFMSSIDLHTHCSYQLMLPEAIAVVASPKFDEVGVYSLTPSYGLDFVANCHQVGFHPHPSQPPIYEESPHVSFSQNFSIQIVDLRR